MNCNLLKFSSGFKFHKSLIIVLGKSSFSYSAVSLKNKCGSKGPPWRVMFFGNDDFSVKSLQMLTSKMRTQTIISKVDVVTTSTGNGVNVKNYAKQEKLDIFNWPVNTTLLDGKYDIGVVVSFGRLIPERIIKCFPQFDVGEIVRQHSCSVGKDETADELKKKLSDMGGHLLIDSFKELTRNLKYAVPQSEHGITYAPKVDKTLSIIDWNVMDSNLVYNKYRALCGLWPLTTTWHGTPVKLLKVCNYQMSNAKTQLQPGDLVYDKQRKKLFVICGGKGGCVSIEKLKIPRHKTMSGKDFFNGFVYNKPISERKFDNTQ
ncbi:PREDICTED: methionyl-tRNA formyltransferase, mitochondrial isoform X2 [Diuraphis noxia]|uniref:methionyl-tRNA formyltransferase, mitochondrial isoform X2 n=1 Tax=Diuraphis noxia TaxID=143948 RepID=UPI000763B2AF|nr:PREDICTED: methionyl-tRNA formyltransferase, mitochondrial isoform X2 [Diuraphis noxia]